ncbi:hypothetical protein CSKR_111998 [Clonorchis sinensis]|uniref:Uncharacterized protein n=1 Tax=Clonorchis sinensis TaxID=79923 RepID=A0A419Q5J9_CLOSI|nr:hypothetical protein CSKR_111998 [Clonorchis sinensis]
MLRNWYPSCAIDNPRNSSIAIVNINGQNGFPHLIPSCLLIPHVISSIKLQSDGSTARLGRLSACFAAESTCFQYCSASRGRPQLTLHRSFHDRSSTANASSFRLVMIPDCDSRENTRRSILASELLEWDSRSDLVQPTTLTDRQLFNQWFGQGHCMMIPPVVLASYLVLILIADQPRNIVPISRTAWFACHSGKSANLLTERSVVQTRPLPLDLFCLGFRNLAVFQPWYFLRVTWQLGTERVLQLNGRCNLISIPIILSLFA